MSIRLKAIGLMAIDQRCIWCQTFRGYSPKWMPWQFMQCQTSKWQLTKDILIVGLFHQVRPYQCQSTHINLTKGVLVIGHSVDSHQNRCHDNSPNVNLPNDNWSFVKIDTMTIHLKSIGLMAIDQRYIWCKMFSEYSSKWMPRQLIECQSSLMTIGNQGL